MFIFGSEGCGIEYAQNSTSGLLNQSAQQKEDESQKCAVASHFFMIMYLKALPIVCPSSMNSNEAAVSDEPGS